MFLCNNFVGLSPFELKKRDYKEVLELQVQLMIYLNRKNKKDDKVWVTSENATWY